MEITPSKKGYINHLDEIKKMRIFGVFFFFKILSISLKESG